MNADQLLDHLADLLADRIIDRLDQRPQHGVLDKDRYLDVDAAAEYLSIPVGQVRKMYQRRELPHLRIGKRVMFDRIEIDDFMHSHAVPTRSVADVIDLRLAAGAGKVGPSERKWPGDADTSPARQQEGKS